MSRRTQLTLEVGGQEGREEDFRRALPGWEPRFYHPQSSTWHTTLWASSPVSAAKDLSAALTRLEQFGFEVARYEATIGQ